MTLAATNGPPGVGTGPAPGPWIVTSRKSEGVTPGFTIRGGTIEILRSVAAKGLQS